MRKAEIVRNLCFFEIAENFVSEQMQTEGKKENRLSVIGDRSLYNLNVYGGLFMPI